MLDPAHFRGSHRAASNDPGRAHAQLLHIAQLIHHIKGGDMEAAGHGAEVDFRAGADQLGNADALGREHIVPHHLHNPRVPSALYAVLGDIFIGSQRGGGAGRRGGRADALHVCSG